MAQYIDLDFDEEVDTFTINGRQYEVGDIPQSILREIMAIKTPLLATKKRKDQIYVEQWIDIIGRVLRIRNNIDNIEVRDMGDDKIHALILFIIQKIGKKQK